MLLKDGEVHSPAHVVVQEASRDGLVLEEVGYKYDDLDYSEIQGYRRERVGVGGQIAKEEMLHLVLSWTTRNSSLDREMVKSYGNVHGPTEI